MLPAAPAAADRAPARPGAAATTAPPAPDGQLGVRLLEASVVRRDDPRARVHVVDSVRPGTTITRRVEVSRRAAAGPSRRIDVELYPGPAEVRGGTFRFGPAGTANELTGWISLSRRALALDPGGTAEVGVTLAVPRTAVAGERYAVVWAQTTSVGAGNVRQVGRVGIRVYLDVGPGGEAPSGFRIGAVRASRDAAGIPVLTAEVRNTGRRALDLTGAVTLSGGPGGVRAGPFDVQAGTSLGIGESGTVRATLDPRLPDGPWTVRLDLRSGTVRQAATVTLSFLGAPAVPVTTADTGAGTPPTLLAAAAAALALLVLALALRSRRRPTPA